MPELPEVETVRRTLAAVLPGRTIETVHVALPRLIKNASPADFAAALRGQTVTAVRRKGKYLRLVFDGPRHLLIHLRMTGSLVYFPAAADLPKSAHIIFRLDKGNLVYCDVRTFGCLWLIPPAGPTGVKGYDTLGPDANGPDFTVDYIWPLLKKSGRTVKAFLLDQTVIAGLGNIYADEALFLAGIRPSRRCGSMTKKSLIALHEAVQSVLAEGITYGGTTITAEKANRVSNAVRPFNTSSRAAGAPVIARIVRNRGNYMYKIGLTGSIATGKSTVTGMLRDLGAKVIDCDRIAHDVVDVGTEGVRRVAAAFGPEAVGPGGAMNREYMGRLVFGDKAAKKRLEEILFPLIYRRIDDDIETLEKAGSRSAVFLDMPLLYEVKYDSYVDEVWLVYVPYEVQLARLVKRDGCSEEEAKRRIHSQLPAAGKKALADVVIDNSGTPEETKTQVLFQWRRLQSRI